MSEIQVSDTERAGASLGGVAGSSEMMEPFDSGNFELESMPMLIWLRGDEPICSEFTMDADTVMVELGIKRSRLTQIAGKELRVGRMRVGRYTRPVFRPSDVLAYKGWVRASASHLKSSRAIEDAAAKLEQETSTLADKVKDAASAELEILTEKMLALHQISQRFFADFAEGISRKLDDELARVEAMETRRNHRDHEVMSAFASLSEIVQSQVLSQVQAHNNLVQAAVVSMTGAIQSQRVELQDLGSDIRSQKEDLQTLACQLESARSQKEQKGKFSARARRNALMERRLPVSKAVPKYNFVKMTTPVKISRTARKATTAR